MIHPQRPVAHSIRLDLLYLPITHPPTHPPTHFLQVSKAAYAQAAQVRAIRKKIVDIIKEKVEKNDLKELVKLL